MPIADHVVPDLDHAVFIRFQRNIRDRARHPRRFVDELLHARFVHAENESTGLPERLLHGVVGCAVDLNFFDRPLVSGRKACALENRQEGTDEPFLVRFVRARLLEHRIRDKVHLRQMEIIVEHDVGIHRPELREHLFAQGFVIARFGFDRIVVMLRRHGRYAAVAAGAFRRRDGISDTSDLGAGNEMVDAVSLEAHFRRSHQRHDIRKVDDVVDTVVLFGQGRKLLRLVRAALRRFDAVCNDLIVIKVLIPSAAVILHKPLRRDVRGRARAGKAHDPEFDPALVQRAAQVVPVKIGFDLLFHLIGCLGKALRLAVALRAGAERHIACPFGFVPAAANDDRN